MRLLLSVLSLLASGNHAASAASPASPTTIIELAFVPPLTGDRRYRWDEPNSVRASARPRCGFGDGLQKRELRRSLACVRDVALCTGVCLWLCCGQHCVSLVCRTARSTTRAWTFLPAYKGWLQISNNSCDIIASSPKCIYKVQVCVRLFPDIFVPHLSFLFDVR